MGKRTNGTGPLHLLGLLLLGGLLRPLAPLHEGLLDRLLGLRRPDPREEIRLGEGTIQRVVRDPNRMGTPFISKQIQIFQTGFHFFKKKQRKKHEQAFFLIKYTNIKKYTCVFLGCNNAADLQ